jgi:hypothetical protein
VRFDRSAVFLETRLGLFRRKIGFQIRDSEDGVMAWLAGGSGLIQVNVKQAGAESGSGESGCGGQRTGGHDGKSQMGLVEEGFSQSEEIPFPTS